MKQSTNLLLPVLFMLLATVSSCEVVGGIFKAGLWVGIIAVVLVIGIIFWLINKAKK